MMPTAPHAESGQIGDQLREQQQCDVDADAGVRVKSVQVGTEQTVDVGVEIERFGGCRCRP